MVKIVYEIEFLLFCPLALALNCPPVIHPQKKNYTPFYPPVFNKYDSVLKMGLSDPEIY